MNSQEQPDLTREQLLERLRAVQDQLRFCEERYRTAFEYTGTAMLVVEEDTTISMANHRLEEISGYPQEDGSKGLSWTQFVLPEDLPRLMDYHIKRRRDPDSVPPSYEYRIRHRSGDIRDILMNVSLIPGTRKSLLSLIDITERKTMERAREESERRYRELFENATDIVYTHDFAGNFTSCNAAATRTYGYGAEEILKLNIYDLVDPANADVARAHMMSKQDGTDVTLPYELMTRTKSGEMVWVEVSTRAVKDAAGVPVGIQGIARNITDRKRAEMNLKESEWRFRETADLLPAVIADLDFDLRAEYVNKYGLMLFGYVAEDVAAGICAKDLIHPDDLQRALTDISNVLSPGYRYGVLREYRMRRKDGTEIDVLSSSSPLLREGAVRGVRACVVDITERKRTLEQLRLSEEKFRRVFEHSPVGIALLACHGGLVEANSSFQAMFGLTDAHDAGFSLIEHIDIAPGDQERLRKGRQLRFESHCTNRDSSVVNYFDWYVTCIEMVGETPVLLLAQVQDVSERKRAEEVRVRKAQESADKANQLVEGLRKEIMDQARFHTMVSRSPHMKAIFDVLPEMAETEATVLITGESGTGKELIARSLHDLGSRHGKPFVAINCSALPDNLLESELFGYKAGAFTDAKKDKLGKFALAQGGTIFLDEIGDISPAMQVKLLRVLQERVYEPLGGVAPVKADVRVIAATNKDLVAMAQAGGFREDLYYRLKVLTVQLPPLRDRRCDIPLLCEHFIGVLNARYRRHVAGLSDEAFSALVAHSFPGNIRELENLIEHAFIFCKGTTIEAQHLPGEITAKSPDVAVNTSSGATPDFSGVKNLEDLERMYIRKVLAEVGGSKIKTADRLGIHKTTLFRKMRQLGME